MAKHYARLWKDVTNTTDEGKAIRTLAEILSDKEGRDFIPRLRHNDAKLCIEILDRGIAKHSLKAAERQAFLVTLGRLAAHHGRLPDSMMITKNIEIEGDIVASGGFADIRRGRYKRSSVALKTLRVMAQDDPQKIRKSFCKEVILWNTLSHPNVLKLFGVWGDMEKGQFTAVYEWMAHGNIMEYIRDNHVNRLELLHGAAQGLKYLHEANLTHGDIKGANIYISNHTPPRACLADFGFTTMVLDPNQPMSCSAQLEGGTVTFMSPELLMPSHFGVKDSVPTPPADVYAFGLVILQVLTGEIPFRRIPLTKLGYLVVGGLRPDKPENAAAIGFSDSLWGFVERCWRGNRDLRPKVSEVVTRLGAVATNWRGLMPPCVLADNIVSDMREELSGSMEHCNIFPQSTSIGLLAGPTAESQTTSEPLGRLSISPTQRSESVGPGGVTPDDSMEYRGIFKSSSPFPRERGAPKAQDGSELESRDSFAEGAVSNVQEIEDAETTVRSLNAVEDAPPKDLAVGTSTGVHNPPGQRLVDFIDKMLEEGEISFTDQPEFLNILGKMCRRFKTIPDSMCIESCLDGPMDEEYDGGCATVFRAKYRGLPVAVKSVHLYLTSNLEECFGKFRREVVSWRHLRHPHILPLIGVNLERHRFAMVSEWMEHGNINEFVKNNKGANRVQLLIDAANGLEYMHSISMMHGDLKGANILINQSLRACLADFGLSTIVGVDRRAAANASLVSVASKDSLVSFTAGGSIRWMSPELLDPDRFGVTDHRPTKKSDCYALGMVIYEVLCGNAPFWEITNEGALIHAIMRGDRPQKPEGAEGLGFTKGLWEMIQRCWVVDANERPDVKDVLLQLNHAEWSWNRKRFV